MNASTSTSLFLLAPLTPISMEFPALATLESSNKISTHALFALMEPTGTATNVLKFLLILALQATSSTKKSISASLKLPHAEPSAISMELFVTVSMVTTGSTQNAPSAQLTPTSMEPNALQEWFLQQSSADQTRSLWTENVFVTQVYI